MKPALLAAVLLSTSFTLPALAEPVSLDALVRQALTQSPALQSAQATAQSQSARIGQARSGYFPQLSLSAGASESNSVSAAQNTSQPFSLMNAGVNLHQQIYNFGKTGANVAAAEATAQAGESQALLTAVQVAYSVRQAYLQWLQAVGLERQATEQLANAKQLLDAAQARLKAGAAARIDVTTARTTYEQARAGLLSARTVTQQARRNLATAMGQRELPAGEPVFPAVPAIANSDLPTLEKQASANHPSLAATEAHLRQAQAQQEAADRAVFPDLSLDGSYGDRARDFQNGQNWTAGVNLSMPLFTGGNLASQKEAARRATAAAAADTQSQEQQVLNGVDVAYLALVGARDKLPAAQAELTSARENFAQAQGRYRAGVGSIIEVSQAQATLASAEGDLVRAQTSYHLAIADLERAVGSTGVNE